MQNNLGNDMLIAVPKKGRVYQKVIKILEETGLEYTRSARLDFAKCKMFPNATILFLPCSDIPQYLDRGNVDIGITGQDMIAECEADVDVELNLGFGGCRLCVLGPKGKYRSVSQLQGCTIGTSFTTLTKKFFSSRGLTVKVIDISGSVEIACPLGLADAVVDLVETGTTMRAAGLEVIDVLMKTEMVLASNKHSRHSEAIQQVVRRIEGYQIARDWVLVSYNLPDELVAQASAITPGMNSPSVVNLSDEGWVALSAMVKRKEYSNVIDQLSRLGATGIFASELKHYRPGLQSSTRHQVAARSGGSVPRAALRASPALQVNVTPQKARSPPHAQDPSNFTSPRSQGRSSGGGQSSIVFGASTGTTPGSPGKSTSPNHHSVSRVQFGDAHGSSRSTPMSSSQAAAQSSNAYANGSNQNSGNFITSRPSTRVHAPPGGKSSFLFG